MFKSIMMSILKHAFIIIVTSIFTCVHHHYDEYFSNVLMMIMMSLRIPAAHTLIFVRGCSDKMYQNMHVLMHTRVSLF